MSSRHRVQEPRPIPFAYTATLRSIDESRDRYREYHVAAVSTLFDYQISTWRGRIGRPLRRLDKHFATQEEMLLELGRILRRRIQHEYDFV